MPQVTVYISKELFAQMQAHKGEIPAPSDIFSKALKAEIEGAELRKARGRHADDSPDRTVPVSPAHALHVFCSDTSASTLRASGVPGKTIVWCDPLIEGATPEGLSDEAWLDVRAEQLARGMGGDSRKDGCRAWLVAQNRDLAAFGDFEEVVLWFDGCLFDQVILIRQIDWFSRQDMRDTALSLLCVGEFPSVDSYHGLGQLHSEQLASLLPRAHRVSAAETQLARAAWAAFRSPDPTRIESLLEGDTSALPYLESALRRHLEQFPSVRNGLSRLEEAVMRVIRDGAEQPAQVFCAAVGMETPAFFGEGTLWACLNALSAGQDPLIRMDGPGPLPTSPMAQVDVSVWRLSITHTGCRVMNGEADYIRLGGIDRWLGGVHLQGEESPWRWDHERGKLRALR